MHTAHYNMGPMRHFADSRISLASEGITGTNSHGPGGPGAKCSIGLRPGALKSPVRCQAWLVNLLLLRIILLLPLFQCVSWLSCGISHNYQPKSQVSLRVHGLIC